MSKRKDQLRAMFEGNTEPSAAEVKPTPQASTQVEPEQGTAKRSTSGAVKAMGLSLDNLSRDAQEAKRLRQSLENADQIIELDPSMIDGSIIEDRLSAGSLNDESFETLKNSLFEAGQQVPVLVRIHPEKEKSDAGWFQAAYGHRRIRAALELGITVKAIVRTLDDAALLVAQGKENADRRDLSYIERAMFAQSMVKGGFDRATAMAALSIDKTEMSRLLQITEAIPEKIIRAIGPASKIGRPRWHALGDIFGRESQLIKALEEAETERFLSASSDERFQLIYARLSKKTKRPVLQKPSLIKDANGKQLAQIVKQNNKTTIQISQTEFADFVAAELPRLAAAFHKAKG